VTLQTITVEQTVSMGHRLPSYKGICSSPHGHNVRFVAELGVHSFVDFKDAGDLLWNIVKYFDHAMVLHEKDPLYKILLEMDFRVFAFPVEPTTEAIAKYVFDQLVARISEGYASIVWPIRVTVHETSKYSASAVR
jgi:6-pyruvoyl-tetrahydropterin synthase